MRTLYVFKIKKEYKNLTRHDEYNLYRTINSINYINKEDLVLAYNLLLNINVPFNKYQINKMLYDSLKKLDGYTLYRNKHKYINYFTKEESELVVKYNYMLLISNKENNRFIKELRKINNLFICDFDMSDYYWLV